MFELRDAFVRWLFLDGDRHAVAAALLLGAFLALLGLGSVGAIAVDEPDAVRGIAGGLIPGLFTFLSIVLAINQLVLSQEYGSADEIRTRVEALREYRTDVEADAGRAPSPIVPTEFLALIARTLESEATTLEDRAAALDDERRESVVSFAETVRADAGRATEILSRSEPGRVNAILSVLDYPYSRQLYEARRIRSAAAEPNGAGETDEKNDASDGDALPPAVDDALVDLVETLEFFSVARTHFRTTYTQRVLAQLSRLLLLIGAPALLATFVLGLLPTVSAPILERYQLVIVSGLLTVALAPFAALFAYILRVATVSERTIAVGPFVSRPHEFETDRDADAASKNR